MIERAKIGSWLSLIGGILITYVSAEISYTHFFSNITMDFFNVPLWYHKFMNDAANGIGYTSLILGILVMVGVFLSFRKNSAFAGGLVSLIFSGLSALVGIVLWLPPFSIVGILSDPILHPPPFHIFPVISRELWAPFYLFGLAIGVAGGIMVVKSSKPANKVQLPKTIQ